MARYRNEMDDERGYYPREERLRRETLGSYDEPFSRRPRFDNERQWENEGRWGNEGRPDYGRGRFGERADYEQDEPRYSNTRGEEGDRFRDQGRRNTLYDIRGDLGTGRDRERYNSERSRLRCRDVMTTDLAVATRDTRLAQVALMMKQEDTGVIPVVEYDVMSGNGRTQDNDRGNPEGRDDRQLENRTYSRGKLVGLITDRDIVIRAVSEGKDCNNTRAEDIMSVDIHTARPNDRVVEVIRTMANKQVRRIPVVNDNRYLVGMISMADVAQEVDDDRELGEALEEISKTTSFWNRVFG